MPHDSIAKANLNLTFALTLAAAWKSLGVTDAVISPGSRSTPLALALSKTPGLKVHVILDERSAGFIALGLAKVNRRPTVVVTTSGTAAAELLPSVVEAYLSQTPLLLCTCDRPPELQHVGAPQSIDQRGLFSNFVLAELTPGVPRSEAGWSWVPLASQAYALCGDSPLGKGPVHLNLPFEEPLIESGAREIIESFRRDEIVVGVQTGHAPRGCPPEAELATLFDPGRKGLIIAGGTQEPTMEILKLASALGWPLVSSPLSGLDPSAPTSIGNADLILRSGRARMELRPEVIVRFGEPHSSKVLSSFISSAGSSSSSACEVVVFANGARWSDPERVARKIYWADWTEVSSSVLGLLGEAERPRSHWLDTWLECSKAVESSIGGLFQEATLFEPSLARALMEELGPRDVLFVSSSMPIRDVEWYGGTAPRPPMVLANRGANGIDGVVSTFLGICRARDKGDRSLTVAYLGDLALLHDLAALRDTGDSVGLIVVSDNNGGAIFSFLPQRDDMDDSDFQRLFATPHGEDLVRLLSGFGLEISVIASRADIGAVIAVQRRDPKLRLAILRSDREVNHRLHEHSYEIAIKAVAGVLNSN